METVSTSGVPFSVSWSSESFSSPDVATPPAFTACRGANRIFVLLEFFDSFRALLSHV
jgi:hypothetical protein